MSVEDFFDVRDCPGDRRRWFVSLDGERYFLVRRPQNSRKGPPEPHERKRLAALIADRERVAARLGLVFHVTVRDIAS